MSKWLEALLDLLFPRKYFCAICRKNPALPSTVWCETCQSEFVPIVSTDSLTHKVLYALNHANLERLAFAPRYKHCWAAVYYEGAVKKAIYHLKYKGDTKLAEPLAMLLVDQMKKVPLPECDCFIPIPLSAQRFKQRGFNQAELLTKVLSAALNKPLESEVLVRLYDTLPQHQLHRNERARNIMSAFAVQHSEHIKGRSICLVDDILTTGSTCNACADVLLKAGAKEVNVAVIAIVRKDHS